MEFDDDENFLLSQAVDIAEIDIQNNFSDFGAEDMLLSQYMDFFDESTTSVDTNTHLFSGLNNVFEEISQNFTLTQVDISTDVDGALSELFDTKSTNIDSETTSVEKSKTSDEPDGYKSDSVLRFDTLQDSEIQERIERGVPQNTRKSTDWSVRAFEEFRNKIEPGDPIPPLKLFTVGDVNKWLGKFIMEVKKRDGKFYPAKSLYLMASGILRYIRSSGLLDMNFLNDKDDRFLPFRKCLDAQMKHVSRLGIGASVKQADPVTSDQEESLWASGKFGFDSAQSLQNAVFFYNCKLFGMRGRDEHRNLETNQFTVAADEQGTFVQFIGKTNKTFKGGLKHKKIENKNIKHYSDGVIYQLYETYLQLLGEDGSFYRRPIKDTKRFSRQALGVNKLESMMKTICSDLMRQIKLEK